MRDLFVELLDARNLKICKENEFEELLQTLENSVDPNCFSLNDFFVATV